MGAALEQVRFTPDRYWHDLRIAVPKTTNLPRFDQRVDVAQMGIVALSLILGRLDSRRRVPGARRRRRRVDVGDLGARRLRAAAAWPCADGWAARCSSSRAPRSRRPRKRAPSSRSCSATASSSRRRRASRRSSSASIRRISGCAGAGARLPEPRRDGEARAAARNQARASASSRPAAICVRGRSRVAPIAAADFRRRPAEARADCRAAGTEARADAAADHAPVVRTGSVAGRDGGRRSRRVLLRGRHPIDRRCRKSSCLPR